MNNSNTDKIIAKDSEVSKDRDGAIKYLRTFLSLSVDCKEMSDAQVFRLLCANTNMIGYVIDPPITKDDWWHAWAMLHDHVFDNIRKLKFSVNNRTILQ